jgi:2-desacetyl-2-hydroxyethyl bacteriochlorophyllide A dehydrogenase
MSESMRAVIWQGPSSMAMAEVPLPEMRSEDVLIKVDAASICGSDLAGFTGRMGNRFPGQIMGHEISGTVVGVSSAAHDNLLGATVCVNPLETCGRCRACTSGRPQQCDDVHLVGVHRHGGFAEFVAVRASNLLPSPVGVPQSLSCLVEPLAHAFHDVRVATSDGQPEDLLLIGAGSIGIFALLAAKASGLPSLTVIEPDPGRRSLAAALGATAVADAEELDGRSFDAVIEGVGLESTRRTAVERVRRGGTVALVGLAQPISEFGFMASIVREVVLRGAFAYTSEDFHDARAYLSDPGLPPQVKIDVVPLEAAPEVFTTLAAGPQSSLKTILNPSLTPA